MPVCKIEFGKHKKTKNSLRDIVGFKIGETTVMPLYLNPLALQCESGEATKQFLAHRRLESYFFINICKIRFGMKQPFQIL